MTAWFNKNGLNWLGFSNLAPFQELRHGVFTRQGGEALPPNCDFNLAFSDIEPPDITMSNLNIAEQALGLPPAAFVKQTHSDRAAVIRLADAYQPRHPEAVLSDYDALITPDPGVSLLVKVADCQAVILYDPEVKVLALVHSGWRGSVQNIIGRTVEKMAADFKVAPNRLRAGISPSLGPCCAEFKNYKEDLPPNFWKFETAENHFDFWAISRQQLTDCGIPSAQVETAGICTSCDSRFFSYRRGDLWGRFGLLAGIAS